MLIYKECLVMMDKKIGKWLLLLLYGTAVYADDVSVEIRLIDSSGNRVAESVADSSLMMEVAIKGTNKPIQKIAIDNIDTMFAQHRGSSTQTSSVNGTLTTQKIMNYIIKPGAVGTYTIGPARVTVGGQNYVSDPVDLTVIDAPRSKSQNDVMIQTHVGKKHVVIGERIPFSMRVYYKSSAKIHGVEPPEFAGVEDMLLEGPFTGTERKGGIIYDYSEWRTTMIPTGVGQLKVPSAKVYYSLPSKRKQQSLFGFSRLFDFDTEQSVEYSQVITVTVDPLPVHEGPVNGIGKFVQFDITSNTDTIRQGEAMVVSLQVASPDTLDTISHPQLMVPDSFTYYESKQSQRFDEDSQLYIKTFEYIVQAQQAGEFSIPSQLFTYFDTDDREYKTLSTYPLYVTVAHAPQAEVKVEQDEVEFEVQDNETADVAIPWFEYGPWNARGERTLSWLLVLVAALAPLCVIVLRSLYAMRRRYYDRHKAYYACKYAYKNACNEIKYIETTGQTQKLYSVFQDYARDRFGFDSTQLAEHVIDVQAWNEFIHRLREYAYSDVSAVRESSELVSQARTWLNYFEGRQ